MWGNTGKCPPQTNGSHMNSYLRLCTLKYWQLQDTLKSASPKREVFLLYLSHPQTGLGVLRRSSCTQGDAGHLSPAIGPPLSPGQLWAHYTASALQTCYPRVTSMTSTQLVCGLRFILGKRVTGLPCIQAFHHIFSCRGTVCFLSFLLTALRHLSPATKQQATLVWEPRSGSLQCEIRNEEINCGGIPCSQRLNPLPQWSQRNTTHIWTEEGEQCCRFLQPLNITHHEQHIHWAGKQGEEREIAFLSHAILVNNCCDHMYARKNHLCIKY